MFQTISILFSFFLENRFRVWIGVWRVCGAGDEREAAGGSQEGRPEQAQQVIGSKNIPITLFKEILKMSPSLFIYFIIY